MHHKSQALVVKFSLHFYSFHFTDTYTLNASMLQIVWTLRTATSRTAVGGNHARTKNHRNQQQQRMSTMNWSSPVVENHPEPELWVRTGGKTSPPTRTLLLSENRSTMREHLVAPARMAPILRSGTATRFHPPDQLVANVMLFRGCFDGTGTVVVFMNDNREHAHTHTCTSTCSFFSVVPVSIASVSSDRSGVSIISMWCILLANDTIFQHVPKEVWTEV